VYCHRIRKYVGAYYAVLGRVDAVVFTAGAGEHDPGIRSRVADRARPARHRRGQRSATTQPGGGERSISSDGAEVPVLVVPTDEEAEIARQTLALTAVQEGRKPRAEYFEPSMTG
jgi:acetate kinase